MQTLSRSPFTTVKTEGGILPADLLGRIAAGEIDGLKPTDYHLAPNERLNEAISRSWNRLLGVWRGFDDQRLALSEADRATTLTRERWLLILFQELGYGRLPFAGKLAIEDSHGDSQNYPISHLWEQTPIHLVAFRQDLDRRDPAVGRSPHSLLQEFLNRWDASMWGVVSNGLRLRVLRDNASLTRAAYVEFDLEAMMAGEIYSDFSLLWLVCHQSRVERTYEREKSGAKNDEELPTFDLRPLTSADCWLERWSQKASEQGARALDALRDGVQDAISALGKGFLAHRSNERLRADLQAGRLTIQNYYRQLLRLVYRLIFLYVAEDRNLVLRPDAGPEARRRYQAYSAGRLRDLAGVRRGAPHPDLYRGLRLLMLLLRTGYEPLGLPGLGGFLFSERSTPDLDAADIANRDLLDAIRALTFADENGVRRPVDYRNLDTEELGSVYESLLELHPHLNVGAAAFALEVVAGSERKTTGTHYTPTPLVNSLLDTALEPVVADRLKGAEEQWRQGADRSQDALRRLQEAALLAIKVLDYAVGSGHMLIGAGRRLARHLARVRTGDEEPSPETIRTSMRDVVRHCLFGVDINEMAVELCKVALWMESLEPGKPLSFLDKNIQCGNSLLGVAPGLDIAEVPDDAFQPVTGDDRATAIALRRRNRRERQGQDSFLRELFVEGGETVAELEHDLAEVEAIPEGDLQEVALKAMYYEDYLRSAAYRRKRGEYDLWTSAFFWPILEGDAELMRAPTQAEMDARRRYQTEGDDLGQQARRIAETNLFFHWELAFPTVFGREGSGFDVVLSNPPWERIKLQEKEWFASRSPEIAAAANAAARKRMIEALAEEDPGLHEAFLADVRAAECESHFIRNSRKYPLCGRGDVNTYAVFAELARQVLSPAGRAGIIVPSGIATDDTTKFYFQDINSTKTLASLYSFENEEFIFPDIHHATKFCLLTLTGSSGHVAAADFVFFARQVHHLRDDWRHFALSAADITLLNPNTRTCPIFRSKRDAELTKSIYRRVPVLVREGPPEENPWGVKFLRMIDMSNDSHLFRTREQLEAEGWRLVGNRVMHAGMIYMPLYEGRMIDHFDHRAASIGINPTAVMRTSTTLETIAEEHQDPTYCPMPRSWVNESDVLDATPPDYGRDWFVAFKDVTSPSNSRTAINTVIPRTAVGHKLPVIVTAIEPSLIALFSANFSAFVLDYVARQSVGGLSLSFFILKQLPFLSPSAYQTTCHWNGTTIAREWFLPRTLELSFTAWDLQPFALDCGYDGPPFRWDEARRFLLRCEMDAAYFHLYGVARDDVDYIMETFPIVKRKDVAAHGEYRTKRVILEIYDAMRQAIDSGEPYQTRLDPPPADPSLAHTSPPPEWVR